MMMHVQEKEANIHIISHDILLDTSKEMSIFLLFVITKQVFVKVEKKEA